MPGADDRCDLSDAEWNDVMRGLEPSESTAEFQARQQAMAEEKAKLVALLQAERRALASSPASSTDVAGLAGAVAIAERYVEECERYGAQHPAGSSARESWQMGAVIAGNIAAALDRLNQPSPPPTGSEREKIVAWLRARGEECAATSRAMRETHIYSQAGKQEAAGIVLGGAADAIERGDHLRGEQ